VQVLHPFAMLGYVFLPDHFHLLIQPSGQSNFSDIMHSLKSNFTREYKQLLGINGNLKFWQKRFWDSVIRDEQDFQGHLDYIHYNPVHHQYVQRPEDWLHSSFSIWQSRGIYPSGWGWTVPTTLKNDDWQLPE
jgi:putative transposase